MSPSKLRFHRRGEGETLLFLHGFFADRSQWAGLSNTLVEQGFSCTSVDLPGHGEASGFKGGWNELLSQIDDWVGQQSEAVSLIGYSMGSRILRRLLLRAGPALERALLIAPHPGLAPAAARARRLSDDLLAAQFCSQSKSANTDYWERLPVFAGQQRMAAQSLAQQRMMRLGQEPSGLARSLRELGSGSCVEGGLVTRESSIELLYGDRQTVDVGRCERLHKLWPQARKQRFSACGHNLILEAPEAVLERITAGRLGGRRFTR